MEYVPSYPPDQIFFEHDPKNNNYYDFEYDSSSSSSSPLSSCSSSPTIYSNPMTPSQQQIYLQQQQQDNIIQQLTFDQFCSSSPYVYTDGPLIVDENSIWALDPPGSDVHIQQQQQIQQEKPSLYTPYTDNSSIPPSSSQFYYNYLTPYSDPTTTSTAAAIPQPCTPVSHQQPALYILDPATQQLNLGYIPAATAAYEAGFEDGYFNFLAMHDLNSLATPPSLSASPIQNDDDDQDDDEDVEENRRLKERNLLPNCGNTELRGMGLYDDSPVKSLGLMLERSFGFPPTDEDEDEDEDEMWCAS